MYVPALLLFLFFRLARGPVRSRLVNALDDTPGRERTWFVIHIDAKANDVQEELLKAFIDRPNVIVMEEGR